ncbi:MAG: 4Fe-4S cluster-binding domain-containing protein [Bacteroidales bacterium]|nr:4Fe-4S cluster-binding domain-containing protein [Bacteroidales bacterium]
MERYLKTISPPNKTISSVCGEQIIRNEENYRNIMYCVSVHCEDGTLLYHTTTGELVLLTDLSLKECDREWLIKHWFLVPEKFDERMWVNQLRTIVDMLKTKGLNKTSFTILTTTDCNARCFYCYEIGIKRIPMASEMAERVADYVANSCGGKRVKLRWFGGEPLYNQQAIDIICDRLRSREIQFESNMISNGFYFDRKTSLHAYDSWRMRKVQITVDGTEKVYNRTKAYIDADESPYLRVMDNIQYALEAGIRVTVRMNMGEHNAKDLLLLADDLAERFHKYPGFHAYVAVINDFTGKMHIQDTMQTQRDNFAQIRDRLNKRGIYIKKDYLRGLRTARCMADNDTSETILPDGRVGRCEHYSDSMITGSIMDNVRDNEVEKKWKDPLSVPECDQCVMYPVCWKLKMCEWNKDGCSELTRNIEIDEIKKQVLEVYGQHKAEE